MRSHVVLIVALLLTAAAVAVARADLTTSSGSDGLIAFAGLRWSSMTESVYVIRPDGTGLRRIVRGGDSPAWSPDGKRLAFARMLPRGWRVYVAHADGTHERAITGYAPNARTPTWSPDGRSIAFVRLPRSVPGLDSFAQQVYVVGADGHGLRRITAFSSFKGGAGRPTWSPDGRRILFWGRRSSADNARIDIWSVRPSGGGTRRLITSAYDPAWSPDGSRIAFARHGDIYTATATGADVKRLTATATVEDSAPAWSPDGTRIVFGSLRRYSDQAKDDERLSIINTDGSGLRRITDTDPNFWASTPAWRAAS